jgi:hypothetical protein
MISKKEELRNHALKDLENCKTDDEDKKYDFTEYKYIDGENEIEEENNNEWSIVEIDGKPVILDDIYGKRILLQKRKQ